MPALIGSGSFNGLSWGPGTKFHISAVSGLDDLPPLRIFVANRPGDHGQFRGVDLLGPRTIVLDFSIIGDNEADYFAQAEAFSAAFLLNTAELPLLIFNGTRLIYCRCRRRSIPYDAGLHWRTATATVELLATDPRKYDATVSNLTAGLVQGAGGVAFNVVFSANFGTVGSAGLIQVTNAGDFAVRPVLTVTGPVDTPILENVTAGKRLRFAVLLGSTDTLVVDLDGHTALLNGTASRRGTMSADSQWWEIGPGASTVRFSNGGGFQAAASLSVPFRSAWI